MDFSAFDKTEIETYAREAKKRWGKTDAYREFEQKTAGQTQDQIQSTGNDLMDIFARLGAIRHLSPDAPEVQSLIGELQAFITEHYYTCTKPILKGLGQMYVAGDAMTDNINAAGGQGTAQFAQEAIDLYCAE